MKTKLLIGLGVAAAIIGIFYVTQTEEVKAPETPEETLSSTTTIVETSNALNTDSDTSTTQTAASSTTTQAPRKAPTPLAPQPETNPLPYTALVVYKDGKFIPEKAVILEGGTVNFLNLSDTRMWIASDNHPTHTRYLVKSDTDCAGSSFDECTSVGNGESWSFTFTRTGTWGYHNHKDARHTGDIRVMSKEDYIKEYQ